MSFWDHFWGGRKHYLLPYQVQQIFSSVIPTPQQKFPSWQVFRLMQQLGQDPYTLPVDRLVKGRLPPGFAYRHFTVPKKDGSRRQLAEPGPTLKAMQYAIIERFLSTQKPHPAAVGYRRQMSVADHAWPHAGASIIIAADIADFFPSTTRYRVRQYWQSHTGKFTEEEVSLLTNLTTYRGSLPQGAPTSPALSNLINVPLDRQLHQLVTATGGTYTRYADDLAFSWRGRRRPPADFEPTVRRLLRDCGYRLHTRKGWQVYRRADEPEITGTVLRRNGTVDVPDAIRERMVALDPHTDHAAWAGYKGYVQMVTKRR